jgi:crooked neck
MYNSFTLQRQLFERFVSVHITVKAWLKWGKFEEKHGGKERARAVYEKAIECLEEDANDEKLFIAFAKFEERVHETERARSIYKYALDHIPKKEAQELYKMWISFEKKSGDRYNLW